MSSNHVKPRQEFDRFDRGRCSFWRPVSQHIPKFASGTLMRMAGMGAQDKSRGSRPAWLP